MLIFIIKQIDSIQILSIIIVYQYSREIQKFYLKIFSLYSQRIRILFINQSIRDALDLNTNKPSIPFFFSFLWKYLPRHRIIQPTRDTFRPNTRRRINCRDTVYRRATTNRDPTNIRLIESPLTFHASLRKRLDDGLCPCYCVIASNGYDRPLLGQEAWAVVYLPVWKFRLKGSLESATWALTFARLGSARPGSARHKHYPREKISRYFGVRRALLIARRF